MNILIVEDEELASERLRDLLTGYDPEIKIMACLDTVSSTVSFLRKHHQDTDLILLDIQLADGKSFEIFQQFNVLTPVIFTTAYDEYAMEAFELNSIDYLMKPISPDKLKKALDKYSRITNRQTKPAIPGDLARQLLEKKSSKQRFVVHSGSRILFKYADEIGYFYAQDKSCFLVEREKHQKYLLDATLEQIEAEVDPSRFFRINRSVIIHLDHIREVRRHLGKRLRIITKIPATDDLTVSRTRVGSFKEWLEG